MGMRASDARWLERDVLPLLEEIRTLPTAGTADVAAAWSHGIGVNPEAAERMGRLFGNVAAQRQNRAGELAFQIRQRTGVDEDTGQGASNLHRMSRNPTVEHYSADVDGKKVPYVDIVRWPCTWNDGCPRQVYPPVTISDDGSYTVEVDWDGDWCWTVTVDDRMAFDFEDKTELERALRLLATGMAIAAGFTSHGSHSYPINRHGPAVGLAPDDLPRGIPCEERDDDRNCTNPYA